MRAGACQRERDGPRHRLPLGARRRRVQHHRRVGWQAVRSGLPEIGVREPGLERPPDRLHALHLGSSDAVADTVADTVADAGAACWQLRGSCRRAVHPQRRRRHLPGSLPQRLDRDPATQQRQRGLLPQLGRIQERLRRRRELLARQRPHPQPVPLRIPVPGPLRAHGLERRAGVGGVQHLRCRQRVLQLRVQYQRLFRHCGRRRL
mmetsp:Transcript_61144/g.189425  ORF Transcript_61144/g.189425 Transcript_61144/m.189425 type:complete len:206 (-) Transcript_61144:309-926(-)